MASGFRSNISSPWGTRRASRLELIYEGLRARRHPLVGFRDGASGRRAALVGGPDVWEIIGGRLGGDFFAGEAGAPGVEGVGGRADPGPDSPDIQTRQRNELPLRAQ